MKKLLLIAACFVLGVAAYGQVRVPNSSMWLKAFPISGSQVNYEYYGTGQEYNVSWGMDVAWNWDFNVRRGTNFIGKENLTTGRLSFQPNDLVDADGNLSQRQQLALQSRINNLKISGVSEAIINCDHEALGNDSNDPNYGYNNYYGKPAEWVKLIKASVLFAQSKGMTITSILPFNEPDYTAWREGTQAHFKEIARLCKEDPVLKDIRICGGNTLNCDQASNWYNYMKPYIDEGNTHELAGSFNNYAKFFQEVRNDGNLATADELHNSMEAFVAIHYGMQNGIWWGFDGLARGDICKATRGGVELGYGENRDAWAAGAVYRLPAGNVEAFVGQSERQSRANWMDFVSTDVDVFYEGYGPVRLYQQYLSGDGQYGSDNQKNADRVIHIHSGSDVPLDTIGGEYIIMNKNTKKLLALTGTGSGATVQQYTLRNRQVERWILTPTPPTKGGDFSFYYVNSSVNTKMYLNLLNNSLTVGGTFILYNAGGSDNEQYCFEYAGDGYYYIRSHLSGLYIETNGTTVIRQNTFTGDDSQKWRLQPIDSKCEQDAPAPPTGLKAEGLSASVRLEWAANTEDDIHSYIILRGKTVNGNTTWETIGRRISDNFFIDNSCESGVDYQYRVQAVDYSGNRSDASEFVKAKTNNVKSLIAEYEFDENLYDNSENYFDAVSPKNVTFTTLHKSGSHGVSLDGSKDYLLLPNQVANQDEMTIAMWVNNGSSTTAWMRLFDFGSGTDKYMFFTPNNGSEGRFVMKNGGDEQILSTSKIGTGWKHLAVTIGAGTVKIFVDAKEVASSTDFTLKPSDIKPALCYIGRSQFKADPLFKGRIDDVRIYNYPLSADELQTVMEDLVNAIDNTNATTEIVSTTYYSISGVRVSPSTPGIKVVVERRADGSVTTHKAW